MKKRKQKFIGDSFTISKTPRIGVIKTKVEESKKKYRRKDKHKKYVDE